MNRKIEFLRYNVIISLFPTQAGGRKSGIIEEYTPNVLFGFDMENLEELWNGSNYQYNTPDTEQIKNSGVRFKGLKVSTYPGGITMGEMYMTKGAQEYITENKLQKNTSFLIREGSRIIGSGVII